MEKKDYQDSGRCGDRNFFLIWRLLVPKFNNNAGSNPVAAR
jgi:hypothetical protein